MDLLPVCSCDRRVFATGTPPLTSRCPLIVLLLEITEEVGYVEVEHRGHIQELNEVKAALAALILGDKGLRALQSVGKLTLRQLGVFPRLHEEFAKAAVPRAIDRFGHGAFITWWLFSLMLRRANKYPKTGYRWIDLVQAMHDEGGSNEQTRDADGPHTVGHTIAAGPITPCPQEASYTAHRAQRRAQ